MDRSAGAELPPLSVRAAVKARLALQLLWLLLSIGWLLLYSVIVIFVIAAPVVAVVVVGLGLRPFLGAVSTRNSLEGDGLVGGVLLGCDMVMVCCCARWVAASANYSRIVQGGGQVVWERSFTRRGWRGGRLSQYGRRAWW